MLRSDLPFGWNNKLIIAAVIDEGYTGTVQAGHCDLTEGESTSHVHSLCKSRLPAASLNEDQTASLLIKAACCHIEIQTWPSLKKKILFFHPSSKKGFNVLWSENSLAWTILFKVKMAVRFPFKKKKK